MFRDDGDPLNRPSFYFHQEYEGSSIGATTFVPRDLFPFNTFPANGFVETLP